MTEQRKCLPSPQEWRRQFLEDWDREMARLPQLMANFERSWEEAQPAIATLLKLRRKRRRWYRRAWQRVINALAAAEGESHD